MADTGLLISHAFSERAIENDSLYHTRRKTCSNDMEIL